MITTHFQGKIVFKISIFLMGITSAKTLYQVIFCQATCPKGRVVRATITLYPIGRPVRATIALYPIGRPIRATITLYPIGRPVRDNNCNTYQA